MEQNIKIPWMPESESYLLNLYREGMEYEPHIGHLIHRYKGLCFELGAGYGLNCYNLPEHLDYFGYEPDQEKFSYLKLNSKHRCCKDIYYLPVLDPTKPLTFLIANDVNHLYQLYHRRQDVISFVLKNKVPVLVTIQRHQVKEFNDESIFWKLAKEIGYYITRISGDTYLLKCASVLKTSDHSYLRESH
jgi:hypothetical protein